MAAYKRSIYLIDPKFQIKSSLFVTTLVLVPSLIYPLLILEFYKKAVTSFNSPKMLEILEQTQPELIQYLILTHIVFISLVFIICIFQSHKIAGPIYKLKKYLQDLREGNAHQKLVFRKGDNFRELADEYNLALDTINRTFYERSKQIEDLSDFVSAKINESQDQDKEVLNEVLKKVAEIKSYQSLN